jgi:hypothetical protein
LAAALARERVADQKQRRDEMDDGWGNGTDVNSSQAKNHSRVPLLHLACQLATTVSTT